MGLGDRVFFAGFRTDVQDLLTAADMLVVASTSEGCPVVILEAMACGCPVICTRVGGSPEIVYEGVTGHVVEPRQPERLARMILALADDAARRREMGQQAARVAREEFTIERMTRRFEEVYTELAQQDAPR
jgi:glycosyltransferase involved in cell wall biosynthesis